MEAIAKKKVMGIGMLEIGTWIVGGYLLSKTGIGSDSLAVNIVVVAGLETVLGHVYVMEHGENKHLTSRNAHKKSTSCGCPH